MQKLIFILLISCICNFVKAQPESLNRVITIDGKEISGGIRTYLNKTLVFYDNIPELNGKTLNIEMVSAIEGPCPEDRKRVILKDNPNVVFKNYKQNLFHSPGDLIKKSASLRLGAIGVGIATGLVVSSGITNDPSVLVAGGILSLGLYVAGEFTQIKAGKLMNSERLAIKPASEGIGLAIVF